MNRSLLIPLTLFCVFTGTVHAAEQYTGYVAGTNVYVRSAPNAYPCAHVSQPGAVTVVGQIRGWLKVLPTKGCFGIISRKYVEPSADSTIGTLTGTNVRVRAGGDLRKGNFSTVQMKLNTGDKVVILGSVNDTNGEWYKIAPPNGAFYWIKDTYVSRDENAAIPRPVDEDVKSKDNAITLITQLVPRERGKKKDPHRIIVAADKKRLEEFNVLDAELKQEMQKSESERNYPAMLDKFKALDVPKNSALRKFVDYRIEYLADEIKREKHRISAADLVESTRAEQQKYASEIAKIEKDIISTPNTFAFDAEGILVSFNVPGATLKRYQLRDPSNSETVVTYVSNKNGKANLSKFDGKHVGVFGKPKLIPELGMSVIELYRPTDIEFVGASPSPAAETIASPAIPETVPEITPAPGPLDKPEPDYSPETETATPKDNTVPEIVTPSAVEKKPDTPELVAPPVEKKPEHVSTPVENKPTETETKTPESDTPAVNIPPSTSTDTPELKGPEDTIEKAPPAEQKLPEADTEPLTSPVNEEEFD